MFHFLLIFIVLQKWRMFPSLHLYLANEESSFTKEIYHKFRSFKGLVLKQSDTIKVSLTSAQRKWTTVRTRPLPGRICRTWKSWGRGSATKTDVLSGCLSLRQRIITVEPLTDFLSRCCLSEDDSLWRLMDEERTPVAQQHARQSSWKFVKKEGERVFSCWSQENFSDTSLSLICSHPLIYFYLHKLYQKQSGHVSALNKLHLQKQLGMVPLD